MEPTRRGFLKTGLLAGAGMAALPRLALGAPEAEGMLGQDTAATGMGAVAGARSAAFTRGVGMYPGAPDEFFGPEVVLDPAAPYRNLALLRPASASSSYDYNLTAQLVTDGIAETRLPDWVVTVVNGEVLPKPDREAFLNHFPAGPMTELPGSAPSVELHIGGGIAVPEVDRIGLFVVVPQFVQPESLTFAVSSSEDGHLWKQVGTGTAGTPLPGENFPPDMAQGSHILAPSIQLTATTQSRFYRVDFGQAGSEGAHAFGSMFRLGQVEFYRGQERINLGGPYSFTSAWKSAGLDEEWVYVDLGARFPVDSVKLHWIARAAEARLQISDDAHAWHELQAVPAGAAGEKRAAVDEIKLSAPATGRYVRLLMARAATEHGYILSEMEVWGHGGFVVRPHAAAVADKEGRLNLAGGSWRLQRVGGEATQLTGEAISAPGYRDAEWLVATVPGTTLTSYLNIGAIPDPNYGQNQLHVSDSYFYADFWYRTEFIAPAAEHEQVQMLDLAGINWKADVYLNGAKLGHIDGGFMRGRFDVTGKLKPGAANALAIRVIKNDTPGSCKQKTLESTGKNGGALGADNPTYHASIGWDWIPTIRGRNTGIWGEIALVTTGAVTLEDPLVTTTLPLPDTSHADVALEFVAVNHTARPFSGVVRGKFGTIAFEQRVTVPASGSQVVKLSPATHKQLRMEKPELWWPVGYGEPHLYDVELTLEDNGHAVHRQAFKAGIRQMTANEDGGILHMFINGRRFIARGGNWGFGESMLRFRAREYDACVRYHRDMNFTMVRNWVGQIGDDAFFEACDRHGVVVWQDFWLANPWDGPIPEDNAMFLANARDFILRIRKHPSVALYCGRNEWFPPKPLDEGIRALLAELHPGIHYIGSSADGPVSGHGPYRALSSPGYFRAADKKLHSEIGAPAIPPIESVRAMMPQSAVWPQSLDWGLHDFTMIGAQGGTAFRTLVDESYGGATNGPDWVALGEMVSYEAYRAMFEAQSKYRMGVLLWMSHPCWPSFVWQTYDFYFQPTSSYFACKLGSEPLHIQWNSLEETIEVVNYSAGNVTGLTAEVEVLNLDGTSVSKKQASLDSTEDSTMTPIRMEYPAGLSAVHFLRLTLSQNGTVRSKNFYLRGAEQADYRAIRTLPRAQVSAQTTSETRGGRVYLTAQLKNMSGTPALFVQLKAVRNGSGDRILPAIYSENYIALMPQETRTVTVEMNQADTRGEAPRLVVEGFNVAAPVRAAMSGMTA